MQSLLSSPSVCLVCLECTVTQRFGCSFCFGLFIYFLTFPRHPDLFLSSSCSHLSLFIFAIIFFTSQSPVPSFSLLFSCVQTISDISYATLQGLSHDQFGDHSYLGSISILKFFFICCFLVSWGKFLPSTVLLLFMLLERDLRASATLS